MRKIKLVAYRRKTRVLGLRSRRQLKQRTFGQVPIHKDMPLLNIRFLFQNDLLSIFRSQTTVGYPKVPSPKTTLPHGIACTDFFAADGFRWGLGKDVPPTVRRFFHLSQRGMP